jgi:hypothetical protein
MGWDGVGMAGEQGRSRSVTDVLTAGFAGQDQTVAALDASVAKGRAHLAMQDPDGQVRPVYLLLDPIDQTDPEHPFLSCKDFPVEESTQQWPARIGEALTTRER